MEENEIYRTAKKHISAVGLTMVIGTAVFIGVQYVAAYFYQLAVGDGGSYNAMFLAEMIPTYVISMPFLIFLLGKLPGDKIPKHEIKPLQFLGAVSCSFGIMITCNIAGLLLTTLIGLLSKKTVSNEALELIGQMHPWVALLIASIAAPVFEEVIFRKMLVTRLIRYGEGTAVLLSGLMFGLFHGNLNQFAYAFGLGAFLAFLYIRTGDIHVTIGIHMIINFSSSVVSTALLRQLDLGEYVEIVQNADFALMSQYASAHLAALIVLILYTVLEYAAAITGVVLLIVFRKKLALKQGRIPLEKGKRLPAIFGNIGVPLFCCVWIVMILLQLLGWR